MLPLYQYLATVIRIVDGDTVDVSVDLGFSIYHTQRLRLIGVDTPEVYGVSHLSEEYQNGKIASAITEEWLKERPVVLIRTFKTEKYGRYLAEIVDKDTQECLNEYLISKGYKGKF